MALSAQFEIEIEKNQVNEQVQANKAIIRSANEKANQDREFVNEELR